MTPLFLVEMMNNGRAISLSSGDNSLGYQIMSDITQSIEQ
jgi:hypothetical protein